MKEEILKEITQFQKFLLKFYDDYYQDEKEENKKDIIRHLSSASKFTTFKRWIIRENPTLFQDFQDYLS